jgi:hypothetical protein
LEINTDEIRDIYRTTWRHIPGDNSKVVFKLGYAYLQGYAKTS